jgi:hypothetical protein
LEMLLGTPLTKCAKPRGSAAFLQNFERAFTDINVTNEIKVSFIPSHLSEPISRYILGQTCLVASFFIAEFNNVKRASNETLKSYISRLSLFLGKSITWNR